VSQPSGRDLELGKEPAEFSFVANAYAHITCIPVHTPPGRPPGDGALGGVRVDSKVRALGPHVAVRDSIYPVAHPHCLAGFEGQDRERSLRDQDPSHPRRVLQMGWLGTSRGRRCVALSFGGGAMTLVVRFTMVLVATTPHHLLWPTAYLWEFDGSTLSVIIGGAPVAPYGRHSTESSQARSDRAETGLIGRSPTDSVGTCRIHTHRRGGYPGIGLAEFVPRRLGIYLNLLSPKPWHLSRRDKTYPNPSCRHSSRRDKTFGSARENFLRALRAQQEKNVCFPNLKN